MHFITSHHYGQLWDNQVILTFSYSTSATVFQCKVGCSQTRDQNVDIKHDLISVINLDDRPRVRLKWLMAIKPWIPCWELNPDLMSESHISFPIPRYAKRPDIALYAVDPLFLLPIRPFRTSPSRFPNMIRFGNSPPLVRITAPVRKSLLVRNVVSKCSHTQLSQGHGCTRSSDGLVSCAVPR